MLNCSPPPSKALSPHAPVIHVMKVGTLFVKYDCVYFLAIYNGLNLSAIVFLQG